MSRLDSFIARMQAQRDCLNFLKPAVDRLAGPILEVGLGNGRTYDHLRELFPGRDIHVGEVVTVRVGALTRTLKVAGLPRSRVAAKQLPEFLTDLTPPAEYERAKQAGIEHLLARQRGEGRPTKKDRRDMGRLFGFD